MMLVTSIAFSQDEQQGEKPTTFVSVAGEYSTVATVADTAEFVRSLLVDKMGASADNCGMRLTSCYNYIEVCISVPSDSFKPDVLSTAIGISPEMIFPVYPGSLAVVFADQSTKHRFRLIVLNGAKDAAVITWAKSLGVRAVEGELERKFFPSVTVSQACDAFNTIKTSLSFSGVDPSQRLADGVSQGDGPKFSGITTKLMLSTDDFILHGGKIMEKMGLGFVRCSFTNGNAEILLENNGQVLSGVTLVVVGGWTNDKIRKWAESIRR